MRIKLTGIAIGFVLAFVAGRMTGNSENIQTRSMKILTAEARAAVPVESEPVESEPVESERRPVSARELGTIDT